MKLLGLERMRDRMRVDRFDQEDPLKSHYFRHIAQSLRYLKVGIKFQEICRSAFSVSLKGQHGYQYSTSKGLFQRAESTLNDLEMMKGKKFLLNFIQVVEDIALHIFIDMNKRYWTVGILSVQGGLMIISEFDAPYPFRNKSDAGIFVLCQN
jgi:hypothetical protein